MLRVRNALKGLGSSAEIVDLAQSARTAKEAAQQLGCPLGAIVKSLVFLVDSEPILVLIAGDRRCDQCELGLIMGCTSGVTKADADFVRSFTGFSIGGVAPLAHLNPMPVLVDSSLQRFYPVYAAAGHPNCIFGVSVGELCRLSNGVLQAKISTETLIRVSEKPAH